MFLHAQRQRLDARQDHEGVEGRKRGTEIAQAEHAQGDGEGEIAEGLAEHHAVIFRARLGEHRIALVGEPVERAAVDHHAAERVAVAAEEFRGGMHDDVRAVVDRLQQVGRRQRIVDDQRHTGAFGDLGDGLNVHDDPAGIGDGFDEDRLGAGRDRRLEGREVVGVGPFRRPAEILVAVIELVDRAAIELGRGDEFIAGRQQGMKGEEFRRVSRRDAERGRAAFQSRDALFEHRRRRVCDARVDVAESLQAEQRGGMIDVVEDEGRRLVDRRGAGAGRGIGLGAGVDGKGGEAGNGRFAHDLSPFVISVRSFFIENSLRGQSSAAFAPKTMPTVRLRTFARRAMPEAFRARAGCGAPPAPRRSPTGCGHRARRRRKSAPRTRRQRRRRRPSRP